MLWRAFAVYQISVFSEAKWCLHDTRALFMAQRNVPLPMWARDYRRDVTALSEAGSTVNRQKVSDEFPHFAARTSSRKRNEATCETKVTNNFILCCKLGLASSKPELPHFAEFPCMLTAGEFRMGSTPPWPLNVNRDIQLFPYASLLCMGDL